VRSLLLLTSAGVSMVLYLSLIPSFGWKGAAAGTLVSETFLAALSWTALVHYQRLSNQSLALEKSQSEAQSALPQLA
jgi:O-antigen/teichoic acid export membrane protein